MELPAAGARPSPLPMLCHPRAGVFWQDTRRRSGPCCVADVHSISCMCGHSLAPSLHLPPCRQPSHDRPTVCDLHAVATGGLSGGVHCIGTLTWHRSGATRLARQTSGQMLAVPGRSRVASESAQLAGMCSHRRCSERADRADHLRTMGMPRQTLTMPEPQFRPTLRAAPSHESDLAVHSRRPCHWSGRPASSQEASSSSARYLVRSKLCSLPVPSPAPLPCQLIRRVLRMFGELATCSLCASLI